MPNNEALSVTVTYPAAHKPYQDNDVPRAETLGTFKPVVLTAFGLTEGTAPDGTVTTYTFYNGKDPLEDLTQTLGSIAGHANHLHLKLAQQIIQGSTNG